MKCLIRWSFVASLALLAVLSPLSATPSRGGNANPGVAPPQARTHGRSCEEWAAAYWQWAFSIPAGENPLLDETGADAALGQSGHVWFLANIWGKPGTVTRNITIPAGTALFFPAYNAAWVNFEDLGLDAPWTPAQEQTARDVIRELVEAAHSVSAEIDGRAVQDVTAYACGSDVFEVRMPQDNLWDELDVGVDFPEGAYEHTVSYGYWLMVHPLPPGQHTVHTNVIAHDGAVIDVTYNITLKAGKK